ncbi:peptidylprolyl isomerase, partial [Vibrio parahaemolyticus]|nr:peptidylprolyl isomerase [Vibrio parahaemolyticus]
TEVIARQILLTPTVSLTDDGAKKQLNVCVRRIKAGEASFAQLASQYSEDPGSAAQDGELGYLTPDLYVPEFKHQVETV